MKKNWYAVYTKPNCEFKVTALLNRKKIENFCPVNNISNNIGLKKRWNTVPLFQSFVFVYISTDQIQVVKETTDVLNFLYWLNIPAIITKDEVKNIERFTNDYNHIQIEKATVNPYAALQITRYQNEAVSSNDTSAKHTSVKMLLPSLGYSIMASVETASVKIFDSPNNNKKELV